MKFPRRSSMKFHHYGWMFLVFCSSWMATTFSFVPNMDKAMEFSSREGNISVYDKAVPKWLTQKLKLFFMRGDRWIYQHPDKIANISQRGDGNLDWVAPISPEFFMKTKTWVVIKKVLADFTGRNDYMAYQAQGIMLRRGDIPILTKGDDASEEIFCKIFLTDGFGTKEGMLFFDQNEEVLTAIKRKSNRLVVWNATLDYQLKKPDFQSFKTEYSILIKMSKNEQKMLNELEFVNNVREAEQQQKLDNFPTYGEKSSKYTNKFYEKHLTRKFYDYHGGVIAVFDGIMNEAELATIRKYLIGHNTAYSNTGYATQEDDDNDNVSWIAMFLPEIIAGTRLLDMIKGMAAYLSGEDGWYPYDVSLNMIQKTFHTRIHEDCESYEFEYTFLLYLNPNWTAEMYGETIFLNQVQDQKVGKKGKVIRDKAFETIVSVKPKYGRMVMFRNNIPHSARPPSPDFHGSRYTFAVKVSRTKMIGLAKVLRELLEFKQGQADEGGQLYETMSQIAESLEFTIAPEEIMSNISKYREVKKKEEISESGRIVSSLLRKQYIGKNQPKF